MTSLTTKMPVATGRVVTTETVQPDDYQITIEAYGEIAARWQTTIRAQVSGNISMISPSLLEGSVVSEGDTLLIIENIYYKAGLAEAENRLALAKVQLLIEERKREEARLNWELGGFDGKPSSPLTFRQPQYEAAQQEMNAAREALKWAQKELTYTVITAPFNGVITKRYVHKGESVMSGDPIAVILGRDIAEIAVHIDERQWSTLPDDYTNRQATVFSAPDCHGCTARIARESGTIDRDTRLRSLFLEVREPLEQTPPLLSGGFVRVSIPGRTARKVLKLPESSMTRRGEIWYVDDDGRLRFFAADPVFTRDGFLYVKPPFENNRWTIVTYPLVDFLSGSKAIPAVNGKEN